MNNRKLRIFSLTVRSSAFDARAGFFAVRAGQESGDTDRRARIQDKRIGILGGKAIPAKDNTEKQ